MTATEVSASCASHRVEGSFRHLARKDRQDSMSDSHRPRERGSTGTPINKFNAEVLIPELRAAKKTVELRIYAD
jgi:hypothetical protein